MNDTYDIQATRLETMLLLSQLHDWQIVHLVHGFVQHMAQEQAEQDRKAAQHRYGSK